MRDADDVFNSGGIRQFSARTGPIGMGVIVFTVIITAVYVRRANSEFDALTAEILKEATK